MKQFMLPFPQDKELQDKRSYANGLHEQPLFSWLWDLLPQMLCRPLLWFCQYNSPGRSFLPDYIGKFNSVFSWGYGISLLEIFLEVFRDSCLNRHNRHVFFVFSFVWFCLAVLHLKVQSSHGQYRLRWVWEWLPFFCPWHVGVCICPFSREEYFMCFLFFTWYLFKTKINKEVGLI